jgi:hypothetical protein
MATPVPRAVRVPRVARPTVRVAAWCVGLAAAGVALSGPAPAVEASTARTVALSYDVYLGGLDIFTFDVDMTLRPDGYRVDAAGGTRGMVGWLYSWTTKLSAEGLDRDGRIEPRRYVVESDWQGNRRTVHLGFAGGGRYRLQRDPPPESDPDIDSRLPDSLPGGTVDPLSLGIAAARALQETGRCDQTVPVFDGQRRYDLTVKHVDQAVLPPNGYSIYHGPAVRCSFSVKRISGFRKSWRSARRLDASSAPPPTIWMARIRPDLPPVPVRYDGAIALGSIVIHLTKAAVRAEPKEPAGQ